MAGVQQRFGVGQGDTAGDGHTQSPTDLLGRVEQPGGQPRLAAPTPDKAAIDTATKARAMPTPTRR